jgi:hypothetical protein
MHAKFALCGNMDCSFCNCLGFFKNGDAEYTEYADKIYFLSAYSVYSVSHPDSLHPTAFDK